MSRLHIPFSTSDISSLARSLRDQLKQHGDQPGHVEMLNMLARAAGHRNFQSLRAQQAARDRLDTLESTTEPADLALVQRLSRYYDAEGRLQTWPSKPSMQEVCLWVLWSRLPARQPLTEEDLNRLIRANHLFGDHALLRRSLCDLKLLTRTADGREYQRVEKQPSPEAVALIHHLTARARAQAAGPGGGR